MTEHRGVPTRGALFHTQRNMPRPQTRRSVSVKGITHQRIKNYTDTKGVSVAGFVEMVIEEHLGPPTPEDRRKFGETQKAREEASRAAQTAQEKPDEPKEAQPLPDPPTPDEPGEGPVEAAPAAAPVEPVKAKPPEPVVELKAAPEPELPRATPAPKPEPKPESPRRTFGEQRHRLSKGSPADDLKRTDEPKEVAEGFEGYIPPILQF